MLVHDSLHEYLQVHDSLKPDIVRITAGLCIEAWLLVHLLNLHRLAVPRVDVCGVPRNEFGTTLDVPIQCCIGQFCGRLVSVTAHANAPLTRIDGGAVRGCGPGDTC